jgi:hypothetical protein
MQLGPVLQRERHRNRCLRTTFFSLPIQALVRGNSCSKFSALGVPPDPGIPRQSGCDERDNQDEMARLDFGMIVAVFRFCNA